MRIVAAAILAMLLVAGAASAVSPIAIFPNNSSAQQLTGLYNPYVFSAGDDTVEAFTSVPFSLEGSAYPLDFWTYLFLISFGMLVLGILLASIHTHIPSMGITAFGILAMGGFAICAMMSPYVADVHVEHNVLQNVDKLGVPIGNNSVYLTQTAVYPLSPAIAQICWGLMIAGFLESVLGALSYFGWFIKTGQNKANRGEYIETDGDDGGYRGIGRKL